MQADGIRDISQLVVPRVGRVVPRLPEILRSTDEQLAFQSGLLAAAAATPLPSLDLTGIDWVIAGGESGPDHRPVDTAWVREIRDRCLAAGVPFFFKQVGGQRPKQAGAS